MPLPLPTDPSTSTLYLDWAKAHAPEHAPQVGDILDLLDERLHERRRKPEYVREHMEAHLSESGLPKEHAPWLLDTIAHRLFDSSGRHATAAYLRARTVEAEHGLTLDSHHTVENALLFARQGLLPSSEVKEQQRRLAALLPPDEAHREFVRFLDAWAAGSRAVVAGVMYPYARASVGLSAPADLVTRVRVSVKALGLDAHSTTREISHVLGRVLAALPGTPVSDGLLDKAAQVFAQIPPAPEHRAGIAKLFPNTVTDGATWLRLLESSGIADAMVEGEVRPEGGYSAWLSKFHHMYCYRWVGQGVTRQKLPEELFTLLPRLAPRIRAENTPVRMREGRYRHSQLEDRLLIVCDDHEIQVDVNEETARSIRQFAHRARHPRRTPDPTLVKAVEGMLGTLRTAPLGEVEQVLAHLDLRLTHFVMDTLDGLPKALEGLDLAEPLARTLRFGVPAEYTWPAFEEAVAEVGTRPGGVLGMTSTWPVLTVYGRDTAVAVDHRGRRDSRTFGLAEEAAKHAVHYVGGDFLVSWVHRDDAHRRGSEPARAFWCSSPDDVFDAGTDPGLFYSGTAHRYDLGLTLQSPDGGRYDAGRVLRPGDRTGIAYAADHATDGTRVWGDGDRWFDGATELDPATGAALEPSSPDFLLPDARLDYVDYLDTRLHLIHLPDGVTDSPLGARDGLAGARVVWLGPGEERPDRYLRYAERALEGTDGRRAPFDEQRDLTYWGVLRMPDNPTEALLAFRWQPGHTVIQCRDTTDDTLLWETWAYPKGGLEHLDAVGRRSLMPPPAFWHFLTPRDPGSSRALRTLDTDTARRLVEVALAAPVPEDPAPQVALPEIAEQAAQARGEAVRECLPRLLPGVTEPAVAEGVVQTVLWAAELRLGVTRMADRTARIRSGTPPRATGEAEDRNLADALSGLVPEQVFTFGFPQHPNMVTAFAADGARLAGLVDEVDRRLAPPGTPATSWTHFLGLVDAIMWRLATGAETGKRGEALVALLSAWAEQPFAEQGTEWAVGSATGTALAPLLAQGRAVITDPPAREQRSANATIPHWSGRYRPETRYTYLRVGPAPVPEDAVDERVIRVERDEAARLRRFLELLDRDGPVTAEPTAVKTFQQRTKAMGALAAFVLSGQMGRKDPVFPLSKGALTEYRKTGAKLPAESVARLLGAGMPDDPADLWRPGGMVDAAERMARVWVELLGVKPTKPRTPELSTLIERDLGLAAEWTRELTAPAEVDTAGWARSLALDDRDGVQVREARTGDQVHFFDKHRARPYLNTATLLAWALTELPVGDPGRAGVADLYERMTESLRSGELYVPLGVPLRPATLAAWAEAAGATPVRVGSEGVFEPGCGQALRSDGVLVLPEGPEAYRWPDPLLSTSHLFDPESFERSIRVLDDLEMDWLALVVRQAGVVCGGGLARMVERAAATPVPAGRFETDPRVSVPGLVAEVSAKLDLDTDAVALYLQLLTLAHPTDRRVRRWNGWTTARHAKAAEPLMERGLIVRGKRPQAGRTLFLPGGWTELKAPFPPMEPAKLATHLIDFDHMKQGRGPFTRALPVAPPHEMFAQAWRAGSTTD